MQMPTGQCFKALSLFTADCFSVKAEAGRPSCGGRRTVCCFGTALNAACASAATLPVASFVLGRCEMSAP